MNIRELRSSDTKAISTIAAVIVVIVIIVIAAGAGAYLYFTGTSSTSSLSSSTSSSSGTSSSSKSSASTIQIVFGATLSMTGTLSAFGQEQNWTLNQAVSDINSLGGIPLSNGTHAMVKLVVLDDATDPNKALTNLQTLVSTDHASIILGELGGVQDSTAQTFATQNKIPYIGPVYISAYKSNLNASTNWVFAPFQNETNEAHVFLNWFHSVDPSTSSHNVTIAFFGEGDPAALYNNEAGEAYARQLGYTVCSCSNLQFTPGDTTGMTNFIQAAKSANAEGVYGLPVPPDAVLMANTAKQLNYQPKAWMLTRGTAVAPFAVSSLGGIGNESQGFMTSFPWDPAVPYQGNLLGHTVNNSQIVNEYQAVWHHPPTLEGVYYTEALIAADAIHSASNFSNVAIRQALLTGTFQTPMGVVNFAPGGQWIQSQQDILLMQWQNVVVPNLGTVQSLQILEPSSIGTTTYVYYPFVWYTNSTNQPKVDCPTDC